MVAGSKKLEHMGIKVELIGLIEMLLAKLCLVTVGAEARDKLLATAAVAGTARAEEATIAPVFNPERASRLKRSEGTASRRRRRRFARA